MNLTMNCWSQRQFVMELYRKANKPCTYPASAAINVDFITRAGWYMSVMNVLYANSDLHGVYRARPCIAYTAHKGRSQESRLAFAWLSRRENAKMSCFHGDLMLTCKCCDSRWWCRTLVHTFKCAYTHTYHVHAHSHETARAHS